MLAAPALAFGGLVRAQQFPTKAQRIVVPVGAGSPGDVLMRHLGEQLTPITRQPVVVDNKPGADGLIAMQALLSAPPDGHTMLLLGPQPLVFNPLLRNDLPYAVEDLRMIGGVAQFWNVLVTGPNSKFGSFEEFAAAARKEKNAVAIGTSGLSFRIGGAVLGRELGVTLRHVPYSTSSQLLTDIGGGILDAAFVPASGVAGMATANKLRVLACASPRRLPQLPQVPTLRESGVNFDWPLWTALAVRAGTPAPILGTLEAQLQKALATKEMQAAVAKLDTFEIMTASAQDISSIMARDTDRLRDIVKQIAAEQSVQGR